MKSNNYYTTRNIKDLERIAELLKELPLFCKQYFIGIESTTSTQTRLKYAYDLRIFFDFICEYKFYGITMRELQISHLNEISNDDIEAFVSHLSHYSFRGKYLSCDERAKARKLCAVRAMMKYFFNKGLLTSNQASKVPTPKLHDKEIIRLNADEVSELIRVAESGAGLTKHAIDYHNKTAIRDTAILSLFLGTGIRISELVGLNKDSFNFKENSFLVTRKGGNQAILFFSKEVRYALEAYIDERSKNPKIPEDEPAFFLSMQNKRINVRTVEVLVKKYSKMVSPLKKITPHKLRSTYGTNLYNATKDIYIVADVLGHRDVNTTKRHYAAISLDNRREAANKVTLRQESPSAPTQTDSPTEQDE